MRRIPLFSVGVFAGLMICAVAAQPAMAQDTMVPAGTLLRCTMDEPNFSSATAQVGDPVLCHLNGIQSFGRAAFPRGSYLGGHLEDSKEPGHFWGKGELHVVFDRIGFPATDVPLGAKVIATRNYKVNRDGEILGKGHAKRDVIEWMIPVLWPWKLMMLPARGPRPTLKGEQTLTLRLMEDVVVPRTLASYTPNRPPQVFGNFRAPTYREQSSYMRPSATPSVDVIRPVKGSVRYVEPVAPAAEDSITTSLMLAAGQASQEPAPQPAATLPASDSAVPASEPAVTWPAAPIAAANAPSAQPAAQTTATAAPQKLTLIAMKNETIYAVTRYWVAGEHLSYETPKGGSGECSLEQVDLSRTTQLNGERGVPVVFRSQPEAVGMTGNVQ